MNDAPNPNAVITFTAVPRRLTDDQKGLEFFLIFSFAVPDDSLFPAAKFFEMKSGKPCALWPKAIFETANRFAVSLNLDGELSTPALAVIDYPEIAEIKRRFGWDSGKYLQGLELDGDDQSYSEAAWETVFGNLAEQQLSSGAGQTVKPRPPIVSPLRRFFDDPTAKIKDRLQPNPLAASDLRPTHRIDSPDQKKMSAFRASAIMALNQQAHRASMSDKMREDFAALSEAGASAEVQRVDRMIKSGRNVGNGGDGTVGQPMSPDVITQPTWQELFGRVAQFPGLQRRLKLALYCRIELADKPSKKLFGTLKVGFDDPFFGMEIQEMETTVVVDPNANFFRANPTGTDLEGSNDLWATTALMPAALFELTQEDGVATAARGCSAAASGGQMPSIETPMIREGIAILSVPANDQTVADDLVSQLQSSRDKLINARLLSESRKKKALAEAQGQKDPASETIIATITAAGSNLLTARDIVRGVSPEVRKEESNWAPLCVRKVELRQGTRTILSWVEEGFVTLAVTATPPPAAGIVLDAAGLLTNDQINGFLQSWRNKLISTGKLAKPDISNMHQMLDDSLPRGSKFTDSAIYSLRDRFKIQLSRTGKFASAEIDRLLNLIQAELITAITWFEVNLVGAGKLPNLKIFNLSSPDGTKPTQINSLIRPLTTVQDLRTGDYVHISAPMPSQAGAPLIAAEVSICPIFAVASKPIEQPILTPLSCHNNVRNENFPVVLHAIGTKYVTSNGKPLPLSTLPDTEQNKVWNSGFLVEGERRNYVRDSRQVNALATASQSDIEHAQFISSPAAPYSLLHFNHVVADVDEPVVIGFPINVAGFNAGLEVAPFILLNGKVALETIRGEVSDLTINFEGQVASTSSNNGNLEIVFVNQPPNLKVSICTSNVLPKGHIIKGTARLNPHTSSIYVTESIVDVTPIDSTVEPPAYITDEANPLQNPLMTEDGRACIASPVFEWNLTLKTLSGETQTVVFPADLINRACKLEADNQLDSRFVPVEATGPGILVECIGAYDGKTFQSRFNPQYLFGTVTWGQNKIGKLTFPNGESLPNLDVTNLLNQRAPSDTSDRFTGFLKVSASPDANGHLRTEAARLDLNSHAISTRWPVCGEVINVELTKANFGETKSPLLRVNFSQDPRVQTWTIIASPQARYIPDDRGLPAARLQDLMPGDYITVQSDLGSKGALDFSAIDPTVPLPVLVGIIGKIANLPAGQATMAMLVEGQADLVAQQVTTEAGAKRAIWTPPIQVDPNALYSISASTAIYAKTVVFTSYVDDNSKKNGMDTLDVNPVHAAISNRLALWKGWSLLVTNPEEGDPDETGEQDPTLQNSSGITTFSLDTMVPVECPLTKLREQATYGIRLRRADLAGNHYFDEPLDESKDFDNSSKKVAYLRPTSAPAAPLLARSFPDGSVGTYQNQTAAIAQSQDDGQARLVIVTNPLVNDETQTGVPFDRFPMSMLPPASAVSTIIESGIFDGRTDYKDLFNQHEAYFDDGALLWKTSGLNYFPDPMVYKKLIGEDNEPLGIVLAMVDSTGSRFTPFDQNGSPAVIPLQSVSLPGSNSQWPDARPLPVQLKISSCPQIKSGEDFVDFYLPPGWTGEAQVLYRTAVTNTTTFNETKLTGIKLIHATTAPRLRPQWTVLLDDPSRQPGDTTERFAGVMTINPRSSAAVRVTSYWNEYWDEACPLHFVKATIQARVNAGKLLTDGVVILNEGDGYGSQAQIVFEYDQSLSPTLPKLVPVISGGKLTGLTILDQGANLPVGLRIYVLRRPPLCAFAKAAVLEIDANGSIMSVTVTDGGSGYASPPQVVFHDMDGDGTAAAAVALLDDNGRVCEIKMTANGKGYSNNVVVGIYTNFKELGEYPVPIPVAPSTEEYRLEQNNVVFQDSFNLNFNQDFGDPKARRAMYIGDLSSRFRDLLAKNAASRASTPQSFSVRATVRPPRPDWHHQAYSYRWAPKRTDNQPVVFRRDMTTLSLQRESAVRVYLRRGWHATGEELLAVSVIHVDKNGMQLTGDYPGQTLSLAERFVTSRWGYDPVWDRVSTPPLSLDDLTNQINFIPYEDFAQDSEGGLRYAGIALHNVMYDAQKELWYADIGLRMPPSHNLPLLQLAVARYQPNALDGLNLSDIVLQDSIRLQGDRYLKIERSGISSRELIVSLTGPFHLCRDASKLPNRQILVEIRRRQNNLSPEIEGPLILDADHDLAFEMDKGELGDSRIALSPVVGDPTQFSGFVTLPINGRDLYLRVIEREIYPSGEPQRDRTGDTSQLWPSSNSPDHSKLTTSADWRPFTCTISIE